MTYATKSDLSKFAGRRYVDVMAAGLTFRFQNLSELEQSRLDAAALGEDGKPSAEGIARMRSRLIAAAWVDGEGRRMCGDSPADLEFIGSLDAGLTKQLVEAIQAHCGIEDADAAAEAFEGTVKN